MKFKKFKDWLDLRETGTGTNSIAVFSRPIGIGTTDDLFVHRSTKKKKSKKKK